MSKEGSLEVWARELEDGSLAVGLFNRGEGTKKITARWEDLGIKGPRRVRDLWRQKEVGLSEGAIDAYVGRHGVALFRLSNRMRIRGTWHSVPFPILNLSE